MIKTDVTKRQEASNIIFHQLNMVIAKGQHDLPVSAVTFEPTPPVSVPSSSESLSAIN